MRMLDGITKADLAVLAISIAMLAALASLPLASGDTATGSAAVANQTPEVYGMDVVEASVNPETSFNVNVVARDNNTLDDFDNIIVKVYENVCTEASAESLDNHYTFWFDPSDNTWHTASGTNTQGSAYIDSAGSTYPSDLSLAKDNYNFDILINGTANHANDWDFYVKVVDEASATDSSESPNEFSVAKYVTYALTVSTLEWTSLSVPSDDNPSDNNANNPLVGSIETNVNYDVKDKLSADWSGPGAETLAASNTSFYQSNTPGSEITMSTTYQDVWTAQSEGEAVTKDIYHWLDIPSPTVEGTYSTTFYIEVAETA